jgi:hypothetical protein
VASLDEESTRLLNSWSELTASEWSTTVTEPAGSHDLGPTTIFQLALMRLTEVEVHACDLDIGLDDWSEVFVSNVLPVRIGWLATRRRNPLAIDPAVRGSWLLSSEDGRWRVEVKGDAVTGDEVTSGPADANEQADCEIRASSRDLLATLLGRPTTGPISISGDENLAHAFGRAFPGP